MDDNTVVIINTLQEGTLLDKGKYRIVRHIASGGFGNTYEAVNNAFDKICAVKEFFMSGINHRENDSLSVQVSNPGMNQTFLSAREKFKKEAQRIYELNNEHIVRVHDLFEENGTVYYVMDYLEGCSLNEQMKIHGHTFSEKQVKDILLQMCDALTYIHERNIWHMDIKPNNIIIDDNGKCTLIDFGASKQSDQNTFGGNTSALIANTPGYAPSEQITGNRECWGPWTDIYALGATAYKLITGNKPPMTDDILVNNIDAFSFSDNVSSFMRNLIGRMMQPAYKNRPKNAQLIIDLIKKEESATRDYNNSEESFVTQYSVVSDSDSENSINAPINTSISLKEEQETLNRNKGIGIIYALFFIIIGLIIGIAVFLLNKHSSNNDSTIVSVDETTGIMTVIIDDVSFNMIPVSGSTFRMGATKADDSNAEIDEEPVHMVTLDDYYIGKTEVTQALWEKVMGNNPSSYKADQNPVEQVSWNDCQRFIKKLNDITDKNFRLPTEAEWEFAARGGTYSVGYIYSGSNSVDDVAWYWHNSGDNYLNDYDTVWDWNVLQNNNCRTHAVAVKECNELGLYDMSGNVWEWCQDWYGDYTGSAQTNPKGPNSGYNRIRRGGCWFNGASRCRITNRGFDEPKYKNYNLGLRLAL